jgi:trk system potassium uptake protein TrkA
MLSRRNEAVAVIGLGRFGSALALELVREGTDVLAVDMRPEVATRMIGKLTHVVSADSTDVESLRELGIPDFKRAVVAIGNDIQASILTTSLLVELGVPDVWAKAHNQQHGRILRRVGAHHVVLPEHEMGERVARTVAGGMLDYVAMDSDCAMIKTIAPAATIGIPLGSTGFRRKYGTTVVAVKHPDGEFLYPTADTVLREGDVIFVFGRTDQVERFAADM